MISVLLLGFDRFGRQPAATGDAVRTLASFVPAIVEGVVRDLCLVGPPADGALADVADHAGCAYVAAEELAQAIRLGVRPLRCPRILVTQAGLVADRPFIDELSSLLPTLDEGPQAYVLKATRHDLIGRLFPSAGVTAAVLAQRRWLDTATATTLDVLARSAKPRRPFKTRVWLGA